MQAEVRRLAAAHGAHACIRMAAIDAYQRDLDVTVVRECVASKDARHHEVTMDYLDGGVARLVTLSELDAKFLDDRTA